MTNDITPASSPFEAIKQTDADGQEFWSARDLMPLMGYRQWRQFSDAIDRAKASADAQGLNALFAVTRKKSGGRPQEDYTLNREAAYLVAMNGDPRKPEVAAAQAYFVVQTMVAETVAEIAPDVYQQAVIRLSEKREWRRVTDQFASSRQWGSSDYARLQQTIYRALFGMTADDIRRQPQTTGEPRKRGGGFRKSTAAKDHLTPAQAERLEDFTLLYGARIRQEPEASPRAAFRALETTLSFMGVN